MLCFLGLGLAKRLTWKTKIFLGQPNQVLWLPQGQLDIKVNFKPCILSECVIFYIHK